MHKVSKSRNKLKKDLVHALGGNCVICGYNRCMGALVFHHKDPKMKEFAVSSSGCARSFKLIIEETKKCLLVCHNCHQEIHNGLVCIDDVVQPYDDEFISNEIERREHLIIKNKESLCPMCGDKKGTKSNLCNRCAHRQRRKERPEKDILIKEINESTYTAVAKKYNVSRTTLKTWIE